MTRRLLVNDMLSALPGHRTFWNDLQDWFGMEFVEGEYGVLANRAKIMAQASETQGWSEASLIVRNASWFPPIEAKCPQIALLQDIFTGTNVEKYIPNPQREMQESVMDSSTAIVFNSMFTQSKYSPAFIPGKPLRFARVIPLPVDFSLFEPGNQMGLQQALSLPDGCVCWVGASQGAAGQIKGYDIFLQIARLNPDISFVAVFKDAEPETVPPNMRTYCRLSQEDLAKVMGACRVGLCTSRMESQHLAGVEMGACGLPMVTPPVGTYWQRKDIPGMLVEDGNYISGIRTMLSVPRNPEHIRAYWKKEFDREIVREQWAKLIEEVEHDTAG